MPADILDPKSTAIKIEAADDLLHLATDLTIAWLSNPNTRASAEDVPSFLEKVHNAVAKLATPAPTKDEPEQSGEHAPAVSLRKSLGV